jgi:multisubunit Na+/H+ antiporter MnhB subunit
MTILGFTLDIVLAVQLLVFAWLALASPDLLKAIVLFVSFCLMMALGWVRVGAPDVALAEAAIGAGLTGALLLAALPGLPPAGCSAEAGDRWVARFSLLPTLGVGAVLGYAVSSLPKGTSGLKAAVTAHLPVSGVSSPVTAVLLNFRGYDTLLEMAVLLLALLGITSLRYRTSADSMPPGRILDTLSRTLPPVLILVAGYLLWNGKNAPGGAFQGGAVLGAAGVLLLLRGWRLPRRLAGMPLKMFVSAGVLTFIFVALVTAFARGRMLEYPLASAGTLILIIETAATISIGSILAALFAGGLPDGEDRE